MAKTDSKLAGFYSALLDFVYPPICLGCGSSLEENELICAACLGRIERYDYPTCLQCLADLTHGALCRECGDTALILFAEGHYCSPMKEIISEFKFKGISIVAGLFVSRLVDKFGPAIESMDADYLVPIPLYRSREYARGYNQAELLARELGEAFRLPVNQTLLTRHKKRKPQASLSAAERPANIRGVFAVTQITETAKRIILVDDVVTTGATVFEAKRELEEAGFTIPAVIAIAHGS